MIFLDSHSTTQLNTKVFRAMEPYFIVKFGNPASPHILGEEAKDAIDEARESVAKVINADPECVFFTSSATEANNIILKHKDQNRKHVVSTNSEHSSIMKSLGKSDASFGINIQSDGTIDYSKLDDMLDRFGDHIKLVSIMTANNEIGTIHDISLIGELCKQYGVRFHTDATQAIGYVNIDVEAMNVFALTCSGHKIYGPKGVGVLYVKDPDIITPLIDGGYQNTITSGTQNVPAIVGMGKACELLGLNKIEALKNMRDELLLGLTDGLPDVIVNGTMENRLPHNLNISIPGVPSEVLIKGLDDIIVSGGSACASGLVEPSHVIKALGNPYPECSIRFGLGRETTLSDIQYTITRIVKIVKMIRS
jgi:cysteine desulfurase